MTEKKICTCPINQNDVPLNNALDFIHPSGKIVARYDKNCDVHGYKVLENKEK